MANLVTPPNGTTTLTQSAVYDSGTINSTLIIDGSNVVVSITGVLTSGLGETVYVEDGAQLNALGGVSGSTAFALGGANSKVEIGSGNAFVYMIYPPSGNPPDSLHPTTAASLTVDSSSSLISIVGFIGGDTI